MTNEEVLDLLRARCKAAGSIAAFARQIHVHRSHLHAVVTEREKIPPCVIVALGLVKKIIYEPR